MSGKILKPLIDINGTTILERSISVLLELDNLEKIVVLYNSQHFEQYQNIIDKLYSLYKEKIVFKTGGATRQESVCIGLEFLNSQIKGSSEYLVAVHDAARCLVSFNDVKAVVNAADKYGAATLAASVHDSLVQSGVNGLSIVKAISRENVYALQTPQVFKFDIIYNQHIKYKSDGKNDFTDDTALLAGINDVYIVQSTKLNLKVTTQEDLNLARALTLPEI